MKIIIFLISFVAWGQNMNDVDLKIQESYPKKSTNLKKIAIKLKQDFISEEDLARAVFTWIAINISYDVPASKIVSNNQIVRCKDSYGCEQKIKRINTKRIQKTLSCKKGVCADYALIFHELATLVGLESQILSGFSKTTPQQIGKKLKISNHAWNAVKIDGTWRLLDVTWGAGGVDKKERFRKNFSSFYFDTPPHLFFKNHFPENGVFNGVTLNQNEFEMQPIFNYNYYNQHIILDNPINGVIKGKKGAEIKLIFKNLNPSERLFYLNSNGEKMELKHEFKENNMTEVFVIIEKEMKKYLNIYSEGQLFITFKIDSK